MKRIEELGISKAPWSIVDFCTSHYGVASVSGYRTSDTRKLEDARLIAASPEMCEALLTLSSVIDDVLASDDMQESLFKLSAAKKHMLEVRAKASGEDVSND